MKSVAQLNWMCICQLTAQTRKAKKAELEAQATTNEPKAEAKTIEPWACLKVLGQPTIAQITIFRV